MSLALAVGLPLKKNTGLISDLQFLPFENHLLVSSLNKKLLLYDCSRPQEPSLFSELELDSSILNVACTLNNSVYLGMLDGSIKQIDFENMKIIGDWILPACATEVNGGVNNLKEIDSGQNTLVWSTFDHELGLLDTRERNRNQKDTSGDFPGGLPQRQERKALGPVLPLGQYAILYKLPS